eukprot:1126325-Lingulodinium_polyedra.AAC.1
MTVGYPGEGHPFFEAERRRRVLARHGLQVSREKAAAKAAVAAAAHAARHHARLAGDPGQIYAAAN